MADGGTGFTSGAGIVGFVAVAIAAIAGFYTFQRLGMFRLFGSIISRCSKDPKWTAMLGKGGEIDQTVSLKTEMESVPSA